MVSDPCSLLKLVGKGFLVVVICLNVKLDFVHLLPVHPSLYIWRDIAVLSNSGHGRLRCGYFANCDDQFVKGGGTMAL